MYPSVAIIVYDTDGEQVYMLHDDILELEVEPRLTTAPSVFNFTITGQRGNTYVYDDIGANFKVKIYLGEGELDEDDCVLEGKILKFHTSADAEGGVTRHFEGKCNGHKLEREQKTNKRWQNVAASTIVEDIAGELDLDVDIDEDTTVETVTVRTEPYFDVLKKVSDYWYDGDTKVQKDFYVDKGTTEYPDGVLVWKSRPLRTSGVETFTYGTDFTKYKLIYDLLPSKNKITVYGAANAYLPTDKDLWTEDTIDLWTASSGTLTFANTPVTPEEGSKCLICSNSDTTGPGYSQDITFQITLPNITIRNINKLFFKYYPGTTAPVYDHQTCKLLCPDSSNYYQLRGFTGSSNNWHTVNVSLGDSNVYDSVNNPTGQWDKVGDPNWWNIQALAFHGDSETSSGTLFMGIDNLYFYPDRCFGSAENTTNQAIYGLREAEYTDENLLTSEECEKRANSLLLQLQDKTIAVTFTVAGNTNVKRGDRLTLTLPPDNITNMLFDVVSVKHVYHKTGGFTSMPQLVYNVDTRVFPTQSPTEALLRGLQNVRNVTSELYSRVVR